MIEDWDFLAWPIKQTEDTNTYEIMNIILWQTPFVINKAVHLDEQNTNIDLTHYEDYVYQMYTCLHCIIVAVLQAAPFIDLLK